MSRLKVWQNSVLEWMCRYFFYLLTATLYRVPAPSHQRWERERSWHLAHPFDQLASFAQLRNWGFFRVNSDFVAKEAVNLHFEHMWLIPAWRDMSTVPSLYYALGLSPWV